MYTYIYIYIYIYSPIFQRKLYIHSPKRQEWMIKPLLHMTFSRKMKRHSIQRLRVLGYGARDGFIRVCAARAQGENPETINPKPPNSTREGQKWGERATT